ncbi:unnamed protein product [Cunninghamella blakesleeana]
MRFLLFFSYFKLLLLILHSITITALIRLPINKQPYNELLKKRGGGSSNSSLYHDIHSLYLIEIGIGTPKQLFYVSIDTGSGDLWVSSTSCPISNCPMNRFDPTRSTSFKEITTTPKVPFNITYGSGSANGDYVLESVTLGGLTIEQQQMALATFTNNIFYSEDKKNPNYKVLQDGIFGLGFPDLTVASSDYHSPYLPFIFQLIEQKIIDQPVFSIYLNHSTNIMDGWDNGELMIGGSDPMKYVGDIHYVPIINPPPPQLSKWNGYWMCGTLGYSFLQSMNASSTEFTSYTFQQSISNQGIPTLIDTGAMLSYFPLEIAQSIMNDIFGSSSSAYQYESSSGHYVFSSTSPSSSLSTCLSLKNQYQHHYLQFHLFQSSSNQNNNNNSSSLVIQISIQDLFITFENDCMFGIGVTSSTMVNRQSSLIIFGDSILKSTYLVFDIGNQQIGFATPNHNGSIPIHNTTMTTSTNSTNINNNQHTIGINVTSHANPIHLDHYIYILLFLSLLF